MEVKGRRAKFVSATLAGADLSGADLRLADFTSADLTGALLVEADLRAARFFKAVLRGADFTGARLERADLLHADLSGARWVDGVTICAEEIVELTATTAREQLTRIRNKCGEDVAVWIGGTLSSAVVIAKSAYELGMDRAILISNIWGFNEKTAKLLGPEATEALGGRLYRVTGAKMWEEVAKMDDPHAKLLVQYITAQGVKTPTEVMVRAWINAYVTAKALEYLIQQGKEITPENIKWAFENMGPVETPFAPPIRFKPGDHRPGFTTFVYVMNRDGSWSQVDVIEVEELPLTNEAYGLDLNADGVP